jgi:hypothetical protein
MFLNASSDSFGRSCDTAGLSANAKPMSDTAAILAAAITRRFGQNFIIASLPSWRHGTSGH